MDAYRAPFPTPESRKPTLVWPRQIPISGEPAETSTVVKANGDWLYSTDIPKLMLSVEPDALMPAPVVGYVEANAANLTHMRFGAGVHFVQEDHPDAIGEALRAWLATLPQYHLATGGEHGFRRTRINIFENRDGTPRHRKRIP